MYPETKWSGYCVCVCVLSQSDQIQNLSDFIKSNYWAKDPSGIALSPCPVILYDHGNGLISKII